MPTKRRSDDRHRNPPYSVRMPERIAKLMDLARGPQSRNQFIIEAVAREIQRRLPNVQLLDGE